MTNRIAESRNSFLVAPNSSLAISSGVTLATPCQKLVIYFSSAGNLTIQTMETVSYSLTSVSGLVDLNCQFDKVTWTGSATAIGFYVQ
jgi:hypothetical protein